MGFCHGNGNLDTDGCCWVDGQVCPLRLKVVGGRVLEGPALVDLGTIEQVAATYSSNPNIRRRIVDQVQGLTYGCRAAVNAIAADASLLSNRAAFEAAWAARPEYQPVADAWQALGRPRNWCPLYGPPEGQCCYSESEAVNQQKRAGLSASAVQIRSGRSL